MGLIDKFEETFLEAFGLLTLDKIQDYVKDNRDAIRFLCSNREKINEKIEEKLEEQIIEKVIKNYYPKLYRGISANSLEYPEYFAHALQKNIFSFEQLQRINFQNDNWRAEFIKKYLKKDLLKREREKLLNLL